MVIWVTGLSGSGKTTLCNALWRLLKPSLPELVLLDGDALRSAVGDHLGYREEDRIVQIKRLQNVAKLLSDQKLVVIVAALYANPELLNWNRRNLKDYFELYLEVSMNTLRRRDTKSLYVKAEFGEICDVVGVDIAWHAPERPDLVLNTDEPATSDELARQIINAIPLLSLVLKKV